MIFERYIEKKLYFILLSLLCLSLYANQAVTSGLGHIYVEKAMVTTFDFSEVASIHKKVDSASETFIKAIQDIKSNNTVPEFQVYVVEGTVITGSSHFNVTLVSLPYKHSLKKSSHRESYAKRNTSLHRAKQLPNFPTTPIPDPTKSNLYATALTNAQVRFSTKYITINKDFLFCVHAHRDTLAMLKYLKLNFKAITSKSKQTYTFPYIKRFSGLAPPLFVENDALS